MKLYPILSGCCGVWKVFMRMHVNSISKTMWMAPSKHPKEFNHTSSPSSWNSIIHTVPAIPCNYVCALHASAWRSAWIHYCYIWVFLLKTKLLFRGKINLVLYYNLKPLLWKRLSWDYSIFFLKYKLERKTLESSTYFKILVNKLTIFKKVEQVLCVCFYYIMKFIPST